MKAAHIILGIAFLVLFASAVAAQDVVQLKNGKTLSGTVLRDDDLKDGFRIRLWNTSGVVYVSWSQVPEAEKLRLLGTDGAAGADVLGELLDGVRILTANREVIGLLADENTETISVKTSESTTPAVIPKSAVLKQENIKIREADAYSPQEMVDRRIAETEETDPDGLFKIAEFARGLKLFDLAREYYEKVKELDETRTEEVDGILQKLDLLVLEAKAEEALKAIHELVEETKFDEALDAADTFLQDYAETRTAEENADIVAYIEAEKKKFEENQDKFLSDRVAKEWRRVRKALLRKYSNRKYKLTEARTAVGKLDDEIKQALADKFKVSADKIEEFWQKREEDKESGAYGSGSWIVLGGQDGGYDYSGTGQNPGQTGKDDPVNDFVRRFGQRGNKKNQGNKNQKNQNKKLQTSQEWWESVSSLNRANWLEAFYAQNSAMVEVIKEEKRNCSYCNGRGTLKSLRNNQSVDVLCPRCHGVKEDLKVLYK